VVGWMLVYSPWYGRLGDKRRASVSSGSGALRGLRN